MRALQKGLLRNSICFHESLKRCSTSIEASKPTKAAISYKTRRQGLLQISRFDPETGKQEIDSYTYGINNTYMVLDLLIAVKAHQDPTLAFRASCSEGVCGSCAMNINGINSLACITHATDSTTVAPLPNMPVIKDLVVDFKLFFTQYSFIRPYVRNVNLNRHHIQSIFQRYEQAMKLRNSQFILEESSDNTCRFTQVPQKATAYFKLLDKLLQKKDVVKAVYVLRKMMKEDGIKLPMPAVKEYIEAFFKE